MRPAALKLDCLGRHVAEALGEGPHPASIRSQRQALVNYMAATATRRSFGPRVASFALAAAAGICVALGGFLVWRDAPSPFWVGQDLARGQPGEWLQASGQQRLPVRFSDESVLELQPDSIGRVVECRGRLVRVTLHHGSMHASITRHGRRSWVFEAGPYRLRDIGTEFTMRWDPAARTLDVSVTTGRVVVEGPALDPRGIAIDRARRLVVNDMAGIARMGPLGQNSQAATAPLERTMEPAGPTAVEPHADAMTLRGASRQPSDGRDGMARQPSRRRGVPEARQSERWKELYSQGFYEDAVAAARALGFNNLIQHLSLADLWQLAEAARYAGAGDYAYDALLALRTRFAASKRARIAAFLLGRVAMEQRQDPRDATAWFSKYIAEDPRGPLVEEAMGRLISANDQAGNKPGAKRAARRYLDSYPGGAFSQLAQAVLN